MQGTKIFCTKYTKVRTFNECREDPMSNKKFRTKKKLNAIAQHALDDIILHETEQENFNSEK